MDQWIRSKFQINLNGWETGKDSFTFINGTKTVESSVDWVASSFPVTTPPTAAALKAADPDNTKGWHIHFDAWKAEGLIN